MTRAHWIAAQGVLFILLVSVAAVAADRGERIAQVVRPATDFSGAERYEAMQAGALTSRATANSNAFSHPSHTLKGQGRMDFFVGNGMFKRLWVSSPSSTQKADGLGPVFNARACQRCHLKDGRGHPPQGPDDNAISMLMRLSLPARTAEDRAALAMHRIKTVPEPVYGGQLQDFAVPGLKREGRFLIDYEEQVVRLADGMEVRLRAPAYRIADLAHGPMDPETRFSPRVAPPMIGMGLLEAIRDEDILANADPEDRDEDGISGRPNWVWDKEAGAPAIGRFGWKAGNPTVRQQTADAFAGDIGISTPINRDPWGDCTAAQLDCRAAPHGAVDGETEVSEEMLRLVAFYSSHLAVPKRRDVDDPAVLDGKRVFYETGCVSCHVPKYVTRDDAADPHLARQLIWPYTDLLLHDMGEGLADDSPEGVANGREWRTPPLWGIGLTETVNGHTFFLHDGRARSLLEAILWHGGEAQASRDRVVALSTDDREALIRFLESL